MLRSGPLRSFARSVFRSTTSPRGLRYGSQSSQLLKSRDGRLTRIPTLELTAYRPLSTSVQRHASTFTPEHPYDHIDKKHEEDIGKKHLKPHPEEVSVDSSVHQVFHEKGVPDAEQDEDMLAGVYSDLVGYIRSQSSSIDQSQLTKSAFREPSETHSSSMKCLGKLSSSVRRASSPT